MYLVVSATRMELDPLRSLLKKSDQFSLLYIGVGPVESAINLTEFLSRQESGSISGIINVGLAGAYPETGLDLLDICLAEKEVFGDIGISTANGIDELDSSFAPPLEFILNRQLLKTSSMSLTEAGIKNCNGNFVTVSSVSGTILRSIYLRDKFGAVCENMEGAAVARVCQKFSIPCLELRCISNMVVERDMQHWMVEEAVEVCCGALKAVIGGMQFD